MTFQVVLWGFQGHWNEVQQVCQESFSGVSRKFPRTFKEVSFKNVSGVFQESFNGVSRKFKGLFKGVLSGLQVGML